MTSLVRKYLYIVATTALFAILGLFYFIDFATRYQNIRTVPRNTKRQAWQYGQPSRHLVTISMVPLLRNDSVLRRDYPTNNTPWRLQNNSSFHGNYSRDNATGKVTLRPVPATTDRAVVIFNVMPKSGSRTLYELAMKLSESSSKDIVVKNTMGGYSQSHANKLQEIRQFVYLSHVGFLYSHMRFQKFGNTEKKPIYVSIVRDPIDRLASLYYFVRYGDNIAEDNTAGREFRERMEKMNYSTETFNECVLNRGTTCRDPGAMVRHFCGTDTLCRNPKMKVAAYKRAIANIDKYYMAIGVMEDYVSTLKVFEGLIPAMFEGVTEMYLGQRRAIVGKMKTKNKTRVSVAARKMLRKEMKDDYNIFYYINRKFKKLKNILGIEADN